MDKAPAEHQALVLPKEDCTQKRPQFKGIRKRKWGSWGSEIRMPKTRAKIWLGSYKTPELAARAYDAAVYCLRGPNANLNFPDSVPSIPSAFSLSPHQIQLAAARYARGELPSTFPSPENINNCNKARMKEEVSIASQSRASSISETELWGDSGQISVERAFWESLFDKSDCINFDNFQSIDDTSALDFIPTWPEEEEQDGYISLDLWNF